MDYYKILSEDENHRGMQYKTGLNTDVKPFNPSGDCEDDEVYFAGEDILAFLWNGPWLRKVTIPEGEEVYENSGYLKKYKAHRVILGEREEITTKVIERLLKEGANVHARDDEALRYAAENGHLEAAKVLLKYGADVHIMHDYALCWAANNGHLEVVKLLLEYGADVHADADEALRWAALNGRVEVVELLVKHGANVHAKDDEAFRCATLFDHLEVVELLRKHM